MGSFIGQKKLFLITASVERTPYMGDSTSYRARRLVWATDVDKAEEAFRKEINSMTDEYSVYYYVQWFEAEEALEGE